MRVLFFTPFAGRNGAEMMLWYIIKYINPEKFACAIYSNYNGPLLSDLPDSVPSFVFTPPRPLSLTLKQRAIRKIKNKLFKPVQVEKEKTYKDFVVDIHESFKPDIWYINTVLCPEAVALAIELNIPYVVHFHDLLFLYQHVTYDNLKKSVGGAHLLIGCSQIVCDKLQIMGGQSISLQYECVDIDKINVNTENVKIIKNKLNIEDSFVWVMSGSVEYRKGTDLIPAIAKALGKSVTILWLGPGSSGYSYYVEQELKYYGLDNVHMLGPKSDDYYDYLSLANGLVLTSREDPFPLVMIEAAAMGIPIVAFNSGGVKEFVIDGMGTVVDSMDITSLVSSMQKIANNEVHFDKEVAVKRANEFNARVQTQLWQEMIVSKFSAASAV